MKHQLLEELIAYLSNPEQSSEDERQLLLAEVQAERYGRPYQSRVYYRMERHYTTDEKEEDGKIVPHPHIVNIGGRTISLPEIRDRIKKSLEKYSLEELRLYHGPYRIKDIMDFIEASYCKVGEHYADDLCATCGYCERRFCKEHKGYDEDTEAGEFVACKDHVLEVRMMIAKHRRLVLEMRRQRIETRKSTDDWENQGSEPLP